VHARHSSRPPESKVTRFCVGYSLPVLGEVSGIAACIITVAVWFIIPLHATQGQLELLLTPHRRTFKYGEYEEAWRFLRNEE
jgi:hypothetical protein